MKLSLENKGPTFVLSPNGDFDWLHLDIGNKRTDFVAITKEERDLIKAIVGKHLYRTEGAVSIEPTLPKNRVDCIVYIYPDNFYLIETKPPFTPRFFKSV